MFTNARNITINGGNFTTIEHIHNTEPAFLKLYQASALGATYDSQDRLPLPECRSGPGAQSRILQTVLEWMSSKSSKPVLRLHGPSKALNSAIASSVAETCAKRGELAASFFFNSRRPKCSSIKYFTPTLALQLALSIPGFQAGLVKSMRDDPLISQRALPSQVETLILEPLRELNVPRSFLIVIDALDDCSGEENQRDILAQISRLVHVHRSCLRFIIVSSSTHHLRCPFDDTESISASLSICDQDVSSQLSFLSHRRTILSSAHVFPPVFF